MQQRLDVQARPPPDGFEHPTLLADKHLLVRIALHVEDGANIDEILALAPSELFDLDRDAVRHLLPCHLDGRLSDEFPDQELLGLVGHHLRGEVLRTLRQERGHHLDQPIEVGPGKTRDRDHPGKSVQPGKRGFNSGHLVRRNAIDFVEHRYHRCADATQAGDHGAVLWRCAVCGIEDDQHGVGVAEGPRGLLYHPLAQSVAGPVEARGIHEHNLSVGQRQNPGKPAPRNLGDCRGDGNLLTHKAVDQRRFADAGAADQGDEARSKAGNRGTWERGNATLVFGHAR